MDKCSVKGWLYLLPAIAFLGVFMVYPLVDVFVYSFEEGYNSASQTFSGVGLFNYRYVLRDPYFLQALKNTFKYEPTLYDKETPLLTAGEKKNVQIAISISSDSVNFSCEKKSCRITDLALLGSVKTISAYTGAQIAFDENTEKDQISGTVTTENAGFLFRKNLRSRC